MKFTIIQMLFAFMLASGEMVKAQGTFQNLDFEEANIVPIAGSPLYPYAITVANALPGWTVDYGTVQQTQILYNDPSIGSTAVTLYANGYAGSPVPTIDGNFSVLLQGGVVGGMPTSASISQTAQIPSGTQSLLFDVSTGTQMPPEVFVGNQQLSLSAVGSGTGTGVTYTIYGANVSAWADQTEQLTFSSPGENFLIDDISFSPNAVPEPNPFVLTGIGGVLCALYRRFAPKRP